MFLRSLATISTFLFAPTVHLRSTVSSLLKPRIIHTKVTPVQSKTRISWLTAVTAGTIASGPVLIGSGTYYQWRKHQAKQKSAQQRFLKQLQLREERAIAYWHECMPDQAAEDFRIKTCLEESKQTYYRQLTALPHGIVAQAYIDQFHQEEETHIKTFYQLIGLTYSPEHWQQTLNAHLHAYCTASRSDNAYRAQEQTLQPCTLAQLNTIDEQLEAHGINPILIQKHLDIDKPEYSMAARCADLYVTPSVFERDTSIFNSIVRHEIVHLLHNDSLVLYTIEALFNLKNIPLHTHSVFYEKWRNFQEKRADILGKLLPEPTVIPCWARHYRTYAQEPAHGHPSSATKALYYQDVHNKIELVQKPR